MEQQISLAGLIETWCREAFVIWGDDWTHISEHIKERLAGLDAKTRAQLEREASITLAGGTLSPGKITN